MRHFLLTLLVLIPFLSTTAQVNIKPETARWFLEVADSRDLLIQKDSLQQQLIQSLTEENLTKDSLVNTYKVEVDAYKLMNETYLSSLRLQEEESRKLRRKNRLKNLLGLVAIGLLIII